MTSEFALIPEINEFGLLLKVKLELKLRIMNTKQKLSYPPVSVDPINAVVNSWFKLPKDPRNNSGRNSF